MRIHVFGKQLVKHSWKPFMDKVTLNPKRLEAASQVIHASKTLAHGETEIGSCDQAG